MSNFLQKFNSQTYGELSLSGVRERIDAFMKAVPDASYRVVIGVDSQVKNHGGEADFVAAIIIHRIGSGGIYFWTRENRKRRYGLRDRIYEEALAALDLANRFIEEAHSNGLWGYDIEIHIDIGTVGETRTLISEVVGMIRGSGYKVKTKPDSYAASKVADRHT